MKELMKMRKDRISKDEKAAKQLKSNNLKYQAIEKKI